MADQPIPGEAGVVESEVVKRWPWLVEEVLEAFSAITKATEADVELIRGLLTKRPIVLERDALPEFLDALGDIDYIVEGIRLSQGVNGTPIANEIHRANMAKFGPGSFKREDGKVQKPPGWTPPDIAGLVSRRELDV